LAGAEFLGAFRTAPVYRLYSIGDVHPGMFEVAIGGVSVAGELYRMKRRGLAARRRGRAAAPLPGPGQARGRPHCRRHPLPPRARRRPAQGHFPVRRLERLHRELAGRHDVTTCRCT
jgi:hypothetical protein